MTTDLDRSFSEVASVAWQPAGAGSRAVVRLDHAVYVLRTFPMALADAFDYEIEIRGEESAHLAGWGGPYVSLAVAERVAVARADEYLQLDRNCAESGRAAEISYAVAYLEAVEAMGATEIAVLASGDVLACRYTDRVVGAAKLLPTNSAGALDAVRRAMDTTSLGVRLAWERRVE